MLGPNNLGAKKICVKKICVQIVLVWKKIFVQKNLVANSDSKKFWVQKKIMGPKKFESEKYFESNIFGPFPFPTAQG